MNYDREDYSSADNFIANLIDVPDAVSGEARIIQDEVEETLAHYLNPVSQTNILLRFLQLKSKWKTDTFFLSSSTEKTQHPAYREIISLGEEVVPYIIQDLKTNHNYWFEALEEITGVDPIPEEHYGKIELMAQDWVDWWNGK